MGSATSTPTFQALASNIYNADKTTPVYSGGWTFKNASAVTTFAVDANGAVTVGVAGTNQTLNGGIIHVAQTNALTDNKSVVGQHWLYIDSTVALTLNGLSGGITGQVVVLGSQSSNALTITHNNGSGTQKFQLPGATSMTIPSKCNATFIFDGANWYCVASSKGVT